MSEKKVKILRTLVLFYLISFSVVNWNDISWLFNYKAVSGVLYDFFNPYPSFNFSAADSNKRPANGSYYSNNGSVEIPSIGVLAPIVFSKSENIKEIVKDLDRGVVYYPGSVLPGQKGQIVVLGHSSPPNWPKIKYDGVFSNLNNLKKGDKVSLWFGGKEYIYRVEKKAILDVGQEITPAVLTNSNNVVVLVSCWPPGKNIQRIAVFSELEPI
ncbi:MAG: class E sortase [Candidatus Staskawiczbacteria bacterium]|nr:class E sortase [Candidatus Staskawiczbacteria bacterium]